MSSNIQINPERTNQTITPVNWDNGYQRIQEADTAKKIYNVVSEIVHCPPSNKDRPYLLSDFFSSDRQGIPIQSFISQKLSLLDRGQEILGRINVLMSYLINARIDPKLSLFKVDETKHSLLSWIKDKSKPGLTQEEYQFLCDSKSSNSGRYGFGRHSLSNTFYGPFLSLDESESLKYLFSGCKIKTNSKGNCPHTLLHCAIESQKLYTMKYLLHVGANANSVDKNSRSGVHKALDAMVNPQVEFETSFSILSALLEYRKPVQKEELFHLLDICCHSYQEGDQIANLRLFDEAISRLLGCENNITRYFDNNRELFLKYVAHMHQMSGEHKVAGQLKSVDLEGLHRDEFIQFRLRLFLQIIVENLRKNKNDLKEEDFASLYDEFLIELEMAWISQLLYTWRRSHQSSDSEKTKRFCDLLSSYAFKQIMNLNPGKEYPIHVGWPGHSICVAFVKSENFLTIRIDNLGSKCTSYHQCGQSESGKIYVQPKLLREYPLAKIENLSEDIKKYLSSLFLNFAFAFNDKEPNEIENLVRAVYDPKLPPSISMGTPKPYSPAQIVGNCTFASFSSGVRQRLQDHLFDWVLRQEAGVLGSIDLISNDAPDYFKSRLADKSVPPSLNLENPQQRFSQRLKEELLRTYQQLLPQEDFPYIMQPIIGDNPLMPPSRERTDLIQIVRSQSSSSFPILIQGAAGSGKTILSKYFSKTWNEREPGIVVHLLLRNLSNSQRYPADQNFTLLEIVQNELIRPLNDIEKRLLMHELNNEKTLWVIDGLDELHVLPNMKESLNELMSKKKLILTSRRNIPQETIHVNIQKTLNLQGYSTEEINQFIELFFSGQPEFIEKVKNALVQNQQLKKLCSIPMTLNVICQLVKQGQEEILVKQDLPELYSCCINAHFREAYRRQRNLTEQTPEYKIQDSYKTALHFMQDLAFESLKDFRIVTSSREIIRHSLDRCKINRNVANQLFEDLKAIGLLEVTQLGAEFVHATFQEYFAACFLIKALKKSKKSEAFKNAQKFIEKHRFDLGYQDLFTFIIHQCFSLILQEEDAGTKQKLIILLSRFFSYFIQPVDQQNFFHATPAFSQGISLLNSYAKGIEKGLLAEQELIDKYGDFIEQSFQSMLSNHITGNLSIMKNENSLIPSLNLPPVWMNTSPIDSPLAALLMILPALKGRLQVCQRLLENVKSHLNHSPNFNVAWNTIFFLQSIQELDWDAIRIIQESAFKIKEQPGVDSLLRGLFEMTLDQISKIVNQPSFSDQDFAQYLSMKESLRLQLAFFSRIVGDQPYEMIIVEKVIRFFDLLSKNKEHSQKIAELHAMMGQEYLPKYVKMMFTSSNWTEVARHCQYFISLRSLGFPLESIFNGETLSPLINSVNEELKLANVRDGRTGRTGHLSSVGFALEHFLSIVDFVDSRFGDQWFEELFRIWESGGCVVSSAAIKGCRDEVQNALIRYQPYVFIQPPPVDSIIKRLNIILFHIFENKRKMFWSGKNEMELYQEKFEPEKKGDSAKRKKLFNEWIAKLINEPVFKLGQHRWLADILRFDLGNMH